MTPHARLKETDEQHFDVELRAAPLVLVKFTGTWCAPCHALHPTLEKLVNEPSRTGLVCVRCRR